MGEKIKKYYCLSEEQLRKLIKASNDLNAFECGGIDNWSYYYDSLDEYYTNSAEELGFDTEEKDLQELVSIVVEEELKTKYQQISDWRMP